jgi:hypothetical protein
MNSYAKKVEGNMVTAIKHLYNKFERRGGDLHYYSLIDYIDLMVNLVFYTAI